VTREIVRLVGVYDAVGSWRGELAHFVRARIGRAHCALCDVTHGLVRERAEWRLCRRGLPVPFVTFHRDDQPAGVRAAGGSCPPVVVAETSDQTVVPLLDGDAIERCAGSPERLIEAIETAVAGRNLRWPAARA
jgi:hypothetical protein